MSEYFDKSHPDSEEHLEDLKRSFKAVGAIRPILINKKTGKIVSGCHRLAAVPEWPVEEVELSPLQEEVIGFHDNVQRRMTPSEISKRITKICMILEGQGIPTAECFSTARLHGYIPLSESYTRDLCPDRFKMRKSRSLEVKAEQPTGIDSLHHAIVMVHEARGRNADYGNILAAIDPATNQPFVKSIMQPYRFFEALHRGASLQRLMDFLLGPREITVEQDVAEVKQLLRSGSSGILRDDDGLQYRVFVVKKAGKIARFEGEQI